MIHRQQNFNSLYTDRRVTNYHYCLLPIKTEGNMLLRYNQSAVTGHLFTPTHGQLLTS